MCTKNIEKLNKYCGFHSFTYVITVSYLGILAFILWASRTVIFLVQDQHKPSEIAAFIYEAISIALAVLSFLGIFFLIGGVIQMHHLMLLPRLTIFFFVLGLIMLSFILCVFLPYPNIYIYLIIAVPGFGLYIYIYYAFYLLYQKILPSKDQHLQENLEQIECVANKDNLIPTNV